MPRTYVDNAYNQRHGRVGLPIGSAVISKNTICGVNTRTYADNEYNRSLVRVGMSHGSAVVSKYNDGGLSKWNYLYTDREKTSCPPSVQPSYEPKDGDRDRVRQFLRDLQQVDTKPKTTVHNSNQNWRSDRNCSVRETTADIRKMNEAVFRSELAQMETERARMSQSPTEGKDGGLRGFTKCRICFLDIEDASVTPCGHHFCTHCIIQLLERNRKCPCCQACVRESELIRDQEFDQVVNELNKSGKENKVLVQKIAIYEKQCEDMKEELYREKELVVSEQQRVITHLRKQMKTREADIDQYRQEVTMWKHKVEQLKNYQTAVNVNKEDKAALRKSSSAKLTHLQQTSTKWAERTGPNALSERELQVVQQPQNCYERHFKGNIPVTEDMTCMLNTCKKAVIDGVCVRKGTGDGISSFVTAYTSLIEENCDLHRNASKFENRIRSLSRELHVAKGNVETKVHQFERKHLYERSLNED